MLNLNEIQLPINYRNKSVEIVINFLYSSKKKKLAYAPEHYDPYIASTALKNKQQ